MSTKPELSGAERDAEIERLMRELGEPARDHEPVWEPGPGTPAELWPTRAEREQYHRGRFPVLPSRRGRSR
jgi:hypothetical protein